MSEVEKAESIIADLERRRVQLIAAGNALTTERDDIAFAAFTAKGGAHRDRLDKLNAPLISPGGGAWQP